MNQFVHYSSKHPVPLHAIMDTEETDTLGHLPCPQSPLGDPTCKYEQSITEAGQQLMHSMPGLAEEVWCVPSRWDGDAEPDFLGMATVCAEYFSWV